jgi:hypothetical protein
VSLRIAANGVQLLAERSASAAAMFAVGDSVAVRVAPGSGWLVNSAPSSIGIAQPASDEAARSRESAADEVARSGNSA